MPTVTTQAPHPPSDRPSDPPSDRVLAVAAGFGYDPASKQTTPHGSDFIDPDSILSAPISPASIAARLTPGSIVLLTGPSGSGKSTLLREIAAVLGPRAVTVEPVHSDRAVIDLIGPDVDSGLALLAASGLAEVGLLLRPPGRLSEGERARLALACAMDRALNQPTNQTKNLQTNRPTNDGTTPHTPVRQPGTRVILADEFGSVLDRPTAAGLGATVRRWIARPTPNHSTPGGAGISDRTGVALVAATAHADMARWLGPGLIVDMEHRAVRPGPARWAPPRVTIEPGTIADYDALASLHYRGGRPGTHQLVLRAIRGGRLAGVLVASPPTRRGAWRAMAWPGRFSRIDAAGMARLNRELRCLSRVVVAPPDRGTGVATALVRAYLRDPLTELTESIAAMGRFSPFFERAGMTAYPVPMAGADRRLLDALESCGLEPWRLLGPMAGPVGSPGPAAEPGPEPGPEPLLSRELSRWAAARATSLPAGVRRGLAEASARGEGDAAVRRAAAWRLCARPVAYAAGGG